MTSLAARQTTTNAHPERRGRDSLDSAFHLDTGNRHAHRIVNPRRRADRRTALGCGSSSHSNCPG